MTWEEHIKELKRLRAWIRRQATYWRKEADASDYTSLKEQYCERAHGLGIAAEMISEMIEKKETLLDKRRSV